MVRRAYVECDVKQGMFSDEAVATVGRHVFIVPRNKVLGELGSRARLAVEMFERDNTVWVVVPTDYRDVVPKTSEMVITSEG